MYSCLKNFRSSTTSTLLQNFSKIRADNAMSTVIMAVKKTPESQDKQQRLPSLPVPALNDTLAKYLRTVKPLLPPEDYKKTTEVVKKFAMDSNLGPKLQSLLENRANSMDNWMSEWWLNSAYLEYRQPVVIFSSPGLVFPLQTFSNLDDQLSCAAKMLYGALSYKEMIDNKKITPDFMGKIPMDMGQYPKIFGTTRTPALSRDVLAYHPNSKHIVIAYKNYFFKIDILDANGQMKKPIQFFGELHGIVNETSGLSGIPVGLLTAEHRDTWATAYSELKNDPNNENSLKTIEEALFVLSIDRPNRSISLPNSEVSSEIENTEISERQTIAALQMLHGNTTNSGNRWFDKTISFIVGTEGNIGLTYEHSPAEGPPIAKMMDFIVKYMDNDKEQLKSDLITKRIQDGEKPILLEFNLEDKAIGKLVAEAKDNLDTLIQDVQMSPFTFRKYGREFIKSCKLSPDSFIQIAIQAAFYRLHKEPAAHYESASVRMFTGGRTECIRSCSMEALDFSKALVDPSISLQDKFKALKTAVEGHKAYAADAVKGQGVDRHFLGLKKIAIENGMNVPDLFLDEGYTKSSHFRLSTSQVPSQFEAFMCYGPLTPDGYGCCYNPITNAIVFGVSAFNSNSETDAYKFKTALQETLLEMEKVGQMSSMQSKL